VRMKEEYVRLAAEERERVTAYTKKWEAHLERVHKEKEAERLLAIEEVKKQHQVRLEEEQAKTREAEQIAKTVTLTAALASGAGNETLEA